MKGNGSRATIDDVAREAGVSVATVSRALRGLPNVASSTRDRVMQVADALHYTADPHASRLAAGRTQTIGLVVPKFGHWYYATVFAAADGQLRESGYDILPIALTDPDARHRFFDRASFRKRVDGLIVVDLPMTAEQLAIVAAARIPVATVGIRTDEFPSITVDNAGGTRLATEHLLARGHQRIGLIGGQAGEPFDYHVPLDRRSGYEMALRDRGVDIDASLIVDAELTLGGGAAAMQELLHRRVQPTAVVAMSDEMAIGAIQVAHDFSIRIPDELSIVGFDDHDVAKYMGLTTIHQDVVGKGTAAATWVLEALAGRPSEEHVVLPTRLIVRRTTAAPSAAVS